MKKTTHKMLATLLIAYLPVHLSAVGYAAETGEKLSEDSVIMTGDINSDGKTDLTDLSELSLAVIGDKTLTNEKLIAADINENGEADLSDLARLRQYLSKVITTLKSVAYHENDSETTTVISVLTDEKESDNIATRPITTIPVISQPAESVEQTTVPSSITQSETRKITLDDILRLSHKGSELDWSDFEDYEYTDVGSGLFIFEYRLEESEYKDYVVLVGGLPEKKPYYVELRPLDYGDRRFCDLTSGSEKEIREFLKGINSDQDYISGFDALSLHKECNYSLQSISVESLPGGYSYSFNNDNNMYKVWDYLSELKLISDFPENPDEYDGMTWVITLTCTAGHTETIYHFGKMFIRDENGSWYKMDYDQASEFQALLEELEYN